MIYNYYQVATLLLLPGYHMVGVFDVDENKYLTEIGFCFAGGVDTTWSKFGNIVGVNERPGVADAGIRVHLCERGWVYR